MANHNKPAAAKKSTLNLTDDEVRAAVAKIREGRAKAKARRDSPEGKAAAKVLREKQAAKRAAILARAKELGEDI